MGCPSPAATVRHRNGYCWGPEKIGPDRGWLTRTTRAVGPCRTLARRSFSPGRSPLTSPVNEPSAATGRRTGSPLRVTVTGPRDPLTRTSASSSLTHAGRLDRTSMDRTDRGDAEAPEAGVRTIAATTA